RRTHHARGGAPRVPERVDALCARLSAGATYPTGLLRGRRGTKGATSKAKGFDSRRSATEGRGSMRMKLHRRAVVLALGALLVTQLGLGYAQAQKTIRVALTGPIVTLDPANYRNRNTENVIRNMFDGLYTVLPDGRTVPEIAEGVTQVDQFTWDFKIREGITFHNGEALTADDVAF